MIDQGLRDRNKGHYNYGGDYGEKRHDAQFCINGLFSPDRVPHPAVFECKYLQQPLTLHLVSFDTYLYLDGNSIFGNFNVFQQHYKSGDSLAKIKIKNRNMPFLKPRDFFSFKYIAKNESGQVEEGQCKYDEDYKLRIKFEAINEIKWLDVEGYLKRASQWAEAGHVLIREQFEVTSLDVAPSFTKADKQSIEGGHQFIVVQSELSLIVNLYQRPILVVSTTDGEVSQFCGVLNNLRTNYSRAATDNDRGGADLLLGFILPQFVVEASGKLFGDKEFSYVYHWMKKGLISGQMETVVVSLTRSLFRL